MALNPPPELTLLRSGHSVGIRYLAPLIMNTT